MKGDFTRSTFKKEKHFHDVRMQQGRVQLDADWNEQLDITAHRVETETVDLVGCCGGPYHRAGFDILPNNKNLEISAGHYYVNGILCENENNKNVVLATEQPDLPKDAAIVMLESGPVKLSQAKKGTYLAYLDVWQRHITALEEPDIREVALGGPDTATRTKTVWQVKLLRVGDEGLNANCLSVSQALDNETAAGTGTMAARTEKSVQSNKPCILAPGAGYRRLENQLYRVEVHVGGKRNQASFKWSRDNGSIVVKWDDKDGDKLTVSSTGRDKVLNFASGQWIELTNDARELLGNEGTLVRLIKVENEGKVLIIDPTTATGPVDKASFPGNRKVRRWDMKEGPLNPKSAGWIDLEDGIQVKFPNGTGTYKTGDYWLIPARTATSNDRSGIEWPGADDNNSESVLPHGIKHQYCKLALLKFDGTWSKVSDCRKIFPPVTELTSLLYVSGDGQEAMPEHKLDGLLRVRVVNGQHPVGYAKVDFAVKLGGGTLSPGSPVSSSPGDGLAECEWTLGTSGKQQVVAELWDAADQPIPGQVIQFNADLSVANEVAYNPAGCDKWADASKIKTVEDAINALCMRVQKGGCAISVGPRGGQFSTLEEAFEKTKGKEDVCFCLLPGEHTIAENIDEKRDAIKIIGCSASIQMAKTLTLRANKIVLLALDMRITSSNGRIVLAADDVSVDQCTFIRLAEAESRSPLILIEPLIPGKTSAIVHWNNNRLIAGWRKQSSLVAERYLKPASTITGIGSALESIIRLSKIDPIADEVEFNSTLDDATEMISKLKLEVRNSWAREKPELINSLRPGNKRIVNNFFTALKDPKMTPASLRRVLATTIAVFYSNGYTEALALDSGVGGWIVDNMISGHLALNYGRDYKPLSWEKTTPEQQKTKQDFANKYRNRYLHTLPTILRLLGNRIFAVRSNANSTMKIIDNILGGTIPAFQPQSCYRSMTVTENVFAANENSFVCGSLIMNGNQFAGATSDRDIAAFVLGYDGILVGNVGSVAADQKAVIEKILVADRTEQSLNLLQIV